MENLYVPDGYRILEPLSEGRETRFAEAEQVISADKDYQAVIETNKGRIVVDLFEEDAPNTVNNFVFLARHRYYDGVVFHRVLEEFMAQTGDPTGSGRGGPGYQFGDETNNGRRHDSKGVLSMANAGPGTNGSQFFITFKETPWLDGKHTVFGAVIEGAEVLDNLQRIDPMRPGGAKPDVMERVYILESTD
jgi:peptidyl-prolyl cis-trans isomerase B (cyclophilin B)